MPKVFKVEKAFLSTVSKEDKTPAVVNTKGGEMHKYMVQFENQSIPGWIGILKKPGNTVNVGEEMYGVLEENEWGKPQFTRMQLPQDGSITLARGESNGNAPAAPVAGTEGASIPYSGKLEAKLDYIISILENRPQPKPDESQPTGGSTNDTSGSIDLSELDY